MAKPSIVKLQLPPHPWKSTAGTTTRHGSPGGILFGLPPPLVHGSEIDAQLFSLAVSPSFTGFELPLLPGSD